MKRAICGALAETDIHALFECPLGYEIWLGSNDEEKLCHGIYCPVYLKARAAEVLESEQTGGFVASCDVGGLEGKKSIHIRCRVQELGGVGKTGHEFYEIIPSAEGTTLEKESHDIQEKLMKVGKVGEIGWGWGAVIRDCFGNVRVAALKQGELFQGASRH